MVKTVGNYYYFLPTYSQAKKVIWEGKTNDGTPFLDFFPKQWIEGKPNDTELKIKFKNGSMFQLIGTDKIDAIVGTNPIGTVFSEFPLQDVRAWQFIRPILAANGGWAIFNGTPRGMNHAHAQLIFARDNRDKWFSEVLPASVTKVIPQAVLDDERKQMPEALYEQEYECKFLEGASQFFKRIHQNKYPKDTVLPESGDFQLGVDLAKYNDWTVLTPFSIQTFIAYPQERFNQIDYNLQKAKIEAMARRFNNALVWPDSTGVGDPIVEDLKARGLNIGGEEGKGFKFTEVSRQNLLNNLAILLEQDKIKIPDDEGLISELEAFQYSLSENGKIRVRVPEGLHDDRVMSLALAVWGCSSPIRPDIFSMNRVERNRARNVSYN